MEQDLHNLKDDMIAFIEGHGMKRFHGIVNDDVAGVVWTPPEEDQPDSWKDFVELAKASGVTFVTMHHVALEEEDVDFLVDRLEDSSYLSEEEVEEARWLKNFIGKVGHIQLGFPCQGVMFVYQISTEWYETFERLESTADDFDGILIDDDDQDD
ncbi:MAG TPA: hypothetical protein VG649_21215 [Candidatus Angelobacter sp.]|jgi:hypothetical protein|nr:hypothetical protein [Candidatus Angelobacter sp.]